VKTFRTILDRILYGAAGDLLYTEREITMIRGTCITIYNVLRSKKRGVRMLTIKKESKMPLEI
jgi:hypothetical protein